MLPYYVRKETLIATFSTAVKLYIPLRIILRIILKCIFKKWNGGMDWIDLAQDKDRWQALVNTVINLWVP
jgi:hypothetical protein